MCGVVLALPWFLKRKLRAELFRVKCDFMFNHTVLDNDALPNHDKEKLYMEYLDQKPGTWRMVFSPRPAKVEHWFGKKELNAFFDADNRNSKINGNLKTN